MSREMGKEHGPDAGHGSPRRLLVRKIREKGLWGCVRSVGRRMQPFLEGAGSALAGLLPRVRKQRGVLYAFYDLSVAPETFDISKFLVLAEQDRINKGCDALHVVIVRGPDQGFREGQLGLYHGDGAAEYETEHLRWRLRNILVPCCWLVPACQQVTVCGSRKEAVALRASLAKHVFPRGRTAWADRYDWRYVLEAWRANGNVPSLRATPRACGLVKHWMERNTGGRKVVTITLREAAWHKDRNSRLQDWAAFARGLDAATYCPVMLRDTEAAFQPLPRELDGLLLFTEAVWNIELRLALYELSYLNMFTNSGPATLCSTDRHARSLVFTFMSSVFDEQFFRTRWGIEPGTQIPATGPFHRLVWADDRLDVIQNAFREMCDQIERSAGSETS